MIYVAAAIFCLRIGAYVAASRRMYRDPPEFGTPAYFVTSLGLVVVALELDFVFDVANRHGFTTGRRFHVACGVFAGLVALTSTLWAWAIRIAFHLLGYC